MKKSLVVFLLFTTTISGYCQLRQIPIEYASKSPKELVNGRIQESGPITLPFWDDFSSSKTAIDTTWWMPGSQVQVLPRPGNGILPPTINVVTFDGVDASGNPYSPIDSDGPTDSLVSRPIDLTQVPASLQGTIYLSFFFQVKGLGNQPEPEDSLHLYFKRSDGSWQKMWPLAGDNIPQDPTIFTEKLISVPNNPNFIHDHFQFKFQAFGRQNGWFDNWNIDYIYMDKRRFANDNSYLDRAFTDAPKTILGQYTAMPFQEFAFGNDPSTFLSNSSTWIRSLENDTQPIQFTAIITDTLNNVILETIANDQELLLFAKDVREAVSSVPDPNVFDLTADSLHLEIKYFANTGDKNLVDSIYNTGADTAFYNNINLRVNDTVRTYLNIHDHYAYDDGSAEFGAGINQKDGRIAYQFVSLTSQFVYKVDIYFPNISRNQAGSPIEIYILDSLVDVGNPFLGFTAGSIQHTGINEFTSYTFAKSIHVQDTFYVAFRNLADDGLWTAIGLDKNTNTGDKIYYSVDGSWLKNTEIDGSLMIRPYFTNSLITGIEYELNNIEIYPNPAQDRINITGQFDQIKVVDITGREVDYVISRQGIDHQLQFFNRPRGLIFVILEQDGKRVVRKILLSP